MGGSDYDTPVSSNSRIANSSRSWQAACDTDISGWDKSNQFIVSLIAVATAHTGGGQVTMKVQWQRDSEGTWYDLAGGELNPASAAQTVLVNCTSPITVGNRSGCNGGLTHGDSHEVETVNNCTIGSINQNEFIEIQVGVSAVNALDGEKYSFRLYDVTEGAALGEVLAEITMATGEVLLAGSTAGQSGADGATKLSMKVSGSIPGLSGASGPLKLTMEVIGSAAGLSGADASLKAIKELIGSLDGQAGVLGSLTLTGAIITLQGSSAGQSGIGGALKLTMELVGSIAGGSGTSSVIKVTRTIAGTSDAQSTAAAVLKAVREIVGSVAAQSGVAGTVKLTMVIAGSLDAVSSLSGDLTVAFVLVRTEVDLAVNIATEAAFDGPLHRSLAIDGPITRAKEIEVEV